VLVDRARVGRIDSFFARDGAGYALALAEIEPESGAAVAECAGGRVIYTGPGMYVNRAMGVGVSEPAQAADVDFIADFYATRDCDAEIELCPYADDVVRARAAELGFRLEWFRNVYALALTSSQPPVLPTGNVELTPVDTSNFATWAGIWVEQSRDADVERRFVRARHAKPGEHDFVAAINGDPVAACSVSIGDGVADLGGMMTRASWRGRGVQAACIAYRLAFAARSGCDLAVTSATPGTSSARNIERAGFQAIYTSVGLLRKRGSETPT
jgi:GNAT superfamily N-acetyltransferase